MSIDTLKAINMSGNKSRSMAKGVQQTNLEMKKLFEDEVQSVSSKSKGKIKVKKNKLNPDGYRSS